MNIETAIRPEFAIGAAVYQPAGAKIGHIARIDAPQSSFTIGGGGIARNVGDVVIIFDNETMTTVPSGIVSDWLIWAAERRIDPISQEEAARRLEVAQVKQAEARAQMARDREEAQAARLAFEAEAASRIPAWAKAVIIAELVEDQSDSMTDYFGSTTKRSVILAFSKHTRDIFSEMRKAAANFAETAPLADAPESAEHREKWSMGGGYYLKAGYRHSSGWRVSKQRFYGADPVKSLPFPAEWSLTAPKPERAPAIARETPSGIRIEEHTHTKKGFQMFICIMPERVDREEFNRLRDLASSLGGWYSRPWGKTPGGFAFKDRAAAETFANPQPSGGDDGPKGGEEGPNNPGIIEGLGEFRAGFGSIVTDWHKTKEAAIADYHAQSQAKRGTSSSSGAATAERLRGLADAMQAAIDDKFRDRLTNTPKRQREADSARMEGVRLQRTQQALRALAAAHEAGTVPPELRGITSKKAAYELVATKIERNGGYYDAGYDTGKPYHDTEAARAIFAMIEGQSEADKEAEELRRKVQALQFAKIPGYFPTPRAVIDKMIDLADMPEGVFSMLEPEAGSGAILDAVKEVCPNAEMFLYERHNSLQEVLKLKGYELTGSDFMESVAEPIFDRILMNPPFENGQDIDHVRHAFNNLRGGGKLVAVMSPGPFFRSDRKAQEFRDWFDERGGEKFDLPPGSFKESGTGTSSVLVVLDGDESLTQKPVSKGDEKSLEDSPYRIGTAHFESEAAADRYYRPYGYTAAEKIAEGEIFIGKPSTCEPDERVILNRSEGRYFIERRR